jgi:molybdate transport system substrate-binding protein
VRHLSLPLLLLILALRWTGQASAAEHELLVSAAMSLKEALTEAGVAFERAQPTVKVSFNFGASGPLRAQIANGAPVDVFVSASADDVAALEGHGLLLAGTRVDVARNTLVLVRPRSGGAFALAALADLSRPEVGRVAIGNPASVPAGRYARETLAASGLDRALAGKLILAENVRQVLDYVARGEVDAGFVYRTDVRTEPRVLVVAEIAEGSHAPIVYPAAVVAASRSVSAARAFVLFLRSSEARALFERHGFGAPPAVP